jgi:osmotically-inducible protein OsmY
MRKTLLTPLVLAAALAVVPAVAAADAASDATTTLKVKLALLTKLGADSLKIDVDTTDGAVRLGGEVGKRETAELARTIAASVEGVTEVDNDLVVETPASTGAVARAAAETEAEVKDGILESKVRLALIDRLGSDGFRIGTEAADGVVTLEFGPELGSDRRALAVKAVEGLEGVARVVTVEKR